MLHHILQLHVGAPNLNGRISIKGDPRSGRSTAVLTEVMVKKVKIFLADRRVMVRFIVQCTKISTGIVHSTLHEKSICVLTPQNASRCTKTN